MIELNEEELSLLRTARNLRRAVAVLVVCALVLFVSAVLDLVMR